MDLATATVLLARGAGIAARLVTGYLPGQFDPLSGTYMVRESDRHAWAEVFFSNSGWVPFDSAP
jgi:transglutaminase-like putative cysteine protease